MKQYKLKNKSTNEELLCTKVVILGFDYFVSEIDITDKDYFIYKNEILIKCFYTKNNWIVSTSTEKFEPKYCKKIIATNNPSIDIPQIVDEVEELATNITDEETFNDSSLSYAGFYKGFIKGYNTHYRNTYIK
jgi:hypothetical protein